MGTTNSRKGAKGGETKKGNRQGYAFKEVCLAANKEKRSLPLVSSVPLLEGR